MTGHHQHRRHKPDTTPDNSEGVDDEPQPNQAGNNSNSGGRQSKSAATELVEMAQQDWTIGTSTTGDTFGIPKTGPQLVFMLRGSKQSFRAKLGQRYFAEHGKAAPSSALADALLTIEGIGQDWETELHLRVAADGLPHSVWVDLGDETGRAVHLTPNGWTLQHRAPVLFRRSALTGPLPEPQPNPTTKHPGADLELLWELLNVEPDDRALVAAWLVAALIPDIPHPALSLFGEQGTGKTTATKLLVSIIDPSPVPARKPPRDAESWITAAAGSWVVGLDNLSTIPHWLSDSMCRAVTGDGDVRRRLYTDGDLHVFAFRRAIVFNGIDVGALNGDLADRMLPINLEVIKPDQRLDETQLRPAWTRIHPQVLAAVLDLTTAVFNQLPNIELATRPRMADFAKILAAVDHVLNTNGLDRYLGKQGNLATEALDTDPLIAAIVAHTHHQWTGTAGQLLTRLTPPDTDPPKDWPTSPRAVTGTLRRWAPVLRKAGWSVTDDGARNRNGVARWSLEPPPDQK